MAEKQTITVLVAGKNYTLSSSDPPEYVRRVAEYVDRKLRETAAMTNLTSAQGAVLTCFQLADELMRAQDENRMLQRRMEEAAEREVAREREEAAELPDPAEPTEMQDMENVRPASPARPRRIEKIGDRA